MSSVVTGIETSYTPLERLMTLLPFIARRNTSAEAFVRTPRTAVVRGTFSSPSGAAGIFVGCYRLERIVDQYGQPSAAGVFTGELVDAAGQRVGMGSRRHTAAVELVGEPDACVARLGPVDVNVLGFVVAMEEVTVAVPRDLPLAEAEPGMPLSSAALLQLVATTALRPRSGRVGVPRAAEGDR